MRGEVSSAGESILEFREIVSFRERCCYGVNRKISDRVRCGMILTGSPGGPRHGKKGTDGA